MYEPVHTSTTGVGKVIVHHPGMLKTINRLLIQTTDLLGTKGVRCSIFAFVVTVYSMCQPNQMLLSKTLTLVLQSIVERTCPCLDLYFVEPGELV